MFCVSVLIQRSGSQIYLMSSDTPIHPDAFLATWQRKLAGRAFFEGAFLGISAASVVLLACALLQSSLHSAPFLPGKESMLFLLPVALLVIGALCGIWNLWHAHITPARAARIADRVLPDSRGRLCAWVELGPRLPCAWKTAMEKEITHYLSAVKIPAPTWSRRILRSAGLVFLICFPSSLALLQQAWQAQEERSLSVAAGLEAVKNLKVVLEKAASSDAPIPDDFRNRAVELLEREAVDLAASRTASEAESIQRGMLGDFAQLLREAGANPDPSINSIQPEESLLPQPATRTPDNTDRMSEADSSSTQRNQVQPDTPGQLVEELPGTGLSSPRMLTELPSLEVAQGQLGSSPQEQTQDNFPPAAIIPQSLPEQVSGADATAPGSPLTQPEEIPQQLSETSSAEFLLPSTEAPGTDASAPGLSTSMDGNDGALRRMADTALISPAGDWDAILEDALSSEIPPGSRSIVVRYFEKLRSASRNPAQGQK